MKWSSAKYYQPEVLTPESLSLDIVNFYHKRTDFIIFYLLIYIAIEQNTAGNIMDESGRKCVSSGICRDLEMGCVFYCCLLTIN